MADARQAQGKHSEIPLLLEIGVKVRLDRDRECQTNLRAGTCYAMSCRVKSDGIVLRSIAKIIDADPPFAPRRGIAQAWSVAETLRAWTANAARGDDPPVVPSPGVASGQHVVVQLTRRALREDP